MGKPELISALHKLHEEFDAHPQLDEPTKASLREIAREINELLEADQSEPSTDDLRSKINDVVSDFEGEHPNMTMLLTQISEFLARIGI